MLRNNNLQAVKHHRTINARTKMLYEFIKERGRSEHYWVRHLSGKIGDLALPASILIALYSIVITINSLQNKLHT